jgi:hypothetical protein
MRKVMTKTYGRPATQREVREYKGKGLPIKQLPVFCSPVLFEPLYAHYPKTARIHFRYHHNGRECVLREIRSTRNGDKRSEALLEFVHGGGMVWLTPDEVCVKPGDGKIHPRNVWDYMEGGPTWP